MIDAVLLERVESILQLSLVEALGIRDRQEAEQWIRRFLAAITPHVAEDLEKWIAPQWVVLAAGLGTRIDRTGRINKNLDVWFGGYNTLQLARRHLPGNQPHIIVLHPSLMGRVCFPGAETLDRARADALLGPDARVVVQPEPDGTGGALRAAIPLLERSEAEFVGIAFGDEPFLEADLFVQTLLSHFIEEADVTLCGKIPEIVVDKGGLFFNADGRFQGTKEWYDMTPAEQQWMWQRLEEGRAYTNTGITLMRRTALLERMSRLTTHGAKSEYHHVDLIRHCYEDGLKTNAYIYRGEITSGVNRWNNVLVGQERLEEQQREQLAASGVRVRPETRIYLGEGAVSLHPDATFGQCAQISGDLWLGQGVRVGDYVRLEDVSLSGATYVGNSVGLTGVTAVTTHFYDNPLPERIGVPVEGLATHTVIRQSRLEQVWVGQHVSLEQVEAYRTLIPEGVCLSQTRLGLHQGEECASSDWLAPDYQPGQQIGDRAEVRQRLMRELDRWLGLATGTPQIRERCRRWAAAYLDWMLDGPAAGENLTVHQLAGGVCEVARSILGTSDPLWPRFRTETTASPLPDIEPILAYEPQHVVWLLGNREHLSREIRLAGQLLDRGCSVTLGAKSVAVLWDATLDSLQPHLTQLHPGAWRVMDTSSNILGIDLRQVNSEFQHALLNADLLVAYGSNRATMSTFKHCPVYPLTCEDSAPS